MPLCHHLIEAIKFKSIPITSYGHLLFPPLNKENSLSFKSFDDLYKAVEVAILMKNEEIIEKRNNLESFYKSNLAPQVFKKNYGIRFLQNNYLLQ